MSAPPRKAGSLAYALPAMPLGALTLALLFVVPWRYGGEDGLDASRLAMLLLAVRVLQLPFGLWIGRVSDAARTRFGRRRPFLWLASVPMLGGVLAYSDPMSGSGEVWFFVTALLALLSVCALRIPYLALGIEAVTGYDGRTRLFGLRALFTLLGIVAVLRAPVVLRYWTGRDLDTGGLTALVIGAAVLGALALVSCTAALREGQLGRVGEAQPERPFGLPGDLAVVARNRSFSLLALSRALVVAGLCLQAVLTPAFLERVLNTGNLSQLLLLLLAGALLGLPLWVRLALAREKSVAWTGALALLCAAQLAAWLLIPGDELLLQVVALLTGLPLGGLICSADAMLADCTDQAACSSGRHLAGLHAGVWHITLELPCLLGAAAGAALLAGLDTPPDGTSAEPLAGHLHRLQTLAPACLTGLACALSLAYRLDRRRHAELRNRLGD